MYTPIFSLPTSSGNLLAPVQLQDQRQVLWGNEDPIVRSVNEGIECWLRFGNDVVIDGLKPVGPFVGEEGLESSRWAAADDFCGTNLVAPRNDVQREESTSHWFRYFHQRYGNILRMARQTANQLGVLSGPDTALTDEADSASTEWSRDSSFRELQKVAALTLDTPVANMEQLAEAFLRCSADALVAFCSRAVFESSLMVPLPSLAVLYYEGEALETWAQLWKPLQKESYENFVPKLREAAGRLGWPQVAGVLADAMAEIYAILRQRRQRTECNGTAWESLGSAERLMLCSQEIERYFEGLRNGVFDPDDPGDESSEFLDEQQKISELLEAERSLGFTLLDYWLNVTRVEALAHEYTFSSHTLRSLRAQCLVRVRDENGGSDEPLHRDLVEAIRNSSFDSRGGTIIPYFSRGWCQLNWPLFGAAGAAQKTVFNHRLLHSQHRSLLMVRAAAAVFYNTQPLSSAVNYASPYLYRQSLLKLASEYGVAEAMDEQVMTLGSAAYLAAAEHRIAELVRSVELRYGKLQLRLNPSNNAMRLRVRLLNAEDSTLRVWRCGTVATLRYEGSIGTLEKWKRNASAATQNELEENVAIEVSLMCSDFQKGDAPSMVEPQSDIEREVERSAVAFYQRATGIDDATVAVSNASSETCRFITMLTDNDPANTEQLLSLRLPFALRDKTTALETGKNYFLRVRCYDLADNHSRDPEKAFEGRTESFALINDLEALCTTLLQRLNAFKGNEFVDGTHLITFCQQVRDEGVVVPLPLEFAVGQRLTADGEWNFYYFLDLMRRGEHHIDPCNDGLTSVQLEAEPRIWQHWRLFHPGATQETWSVTRRRELNAALECEGDWWRLDDHLDAPIDSESLVARMRYSADICSVLTAAASTKMVSVVLGGDGAMQQLSFSSLAEHASIEELTSQIRNAHNSALFRFCTLSGSKIGNFKKRAQKAMFVDRDHTDIGGRYARTQQFAFETAQRDVMEDRIGQFRESDYIREKPVDRYASKDHPELRKKQFVHGVTNYAGVPVHADTAHPWGNEY